MSDGGRVRSALASRPLHLALLAAGTLFLLSDAFHGNVWFDESYSVAIANHSFADIWSIGSGDVHPVLFYWALHALNLVFGQNVLAYRLFAVAGAVALAALGYTHLRRDFGWRVGVLFTVLALFTPYVAVMAVEIRMYSWATFAVMLCAVSAWRIFVRARAGERVGAGTWAAFFASSLASAYLHYFGAMAAFMVNALLLAYLVAAALRRRAAPRVLGAFAAGALGQVLLYLPWLAVVASQVGVVSQTYWANIVFPTTYIELATYPVMTSQVSFAARGAYGAGWQGVLAAMAALALVLLVALVGRAVRHALRDGRRRPDGEGAPGGRGAQGRLRRLRGWLVSDRVLPVLAAWAVYGGVYLIAWTASYAMDSLILYYRYLFVAIGPLLFSVAMLLSLVRSRVLVGGAVAVLVGTSAVSQALLVGDDYAAENGVALQSFAETVDQVSQETAGAPLVVSTDIGFMGVTAVTYGDVPQTYMDWQKGNWDRAYQAYAPTLTSEKSWELILDDFEGPFVVLGQSQQGEEPRDIADLKQKRGVTLRQEETFYRPYERTYFTIAVMEKDGGGPLAPR